MTAPSIGYTVKGILFFLKLLHESIVYWASEIAAVHIVYTISSHERLFYPLDYLNIYVLFTKGFSFITTETIYVKHWGRTVVE